jgi:hypothetical protein
MISVPLPLQVFFLMAGVRRLDGEGPAHSPLGEVIDAAEVVQQGLHSPLRIH